MTDDELIAELLNHLSSPSQSHWHRVAAILRARLQPRYPETYAGASEALTRAIGLTVGAMRTLAVLETAHDRGAGCPVCTARNPFPTIGRGCTILSPPDGSVVFNGPRAAQGGE